MRAVIVGGGKIGSELAGHLLAADAAVIVIEQDEERAQRLSDLGRALVLTGDGTDMRRLQSLDLRPSDVFVAVTGVDEDNLVACQLASAAFGVRRVLARMNDPRNRQAFRALGVPTVNVTDEMTAMIERSLDLAEQIDHALPDRGELVTSELIVPEGFSETELAELRLPPSTVVVTVSRGPAVEVAGPTTRLQPGDRLLVVTHATSVESLATIFPSGATG